MADDAGDDPPPQAPGNGAGGAQAAPAAAAVVADEALHDFSQPRLVGPLAKLPRCEMFRHAQKDCTLDCCKLNEQFGGADNRLFTPTDDPAKNRELKGVELQQAQLAQQRDALGKAVKYPRPIKAELMTRFGGANLPQPINYPAVSVGMQLLLQADHAFFVGASRPQLDALRTGAGGAAPVHPHTLPALKPGLAGPYSYEPVKFNYSHLKIHPPQVKFDKNTGEEEDKSRYMDSSWVAMQKTICCLTAGQIVDTGKDVTTGESLVGAEAVKGAFEKIKYYNRHGKGQPAFNYDKMNQVLCAFYKDAVKVDSPYATVSALANKAGDLWRQTEIYNPKCDNKSQAFHKRKDAEKRADGDSLKAVSRQSNHKRAALKRAFAELSIDSVDGIKDQNKDKMLRWHAVFCGTQLGKRIAGQEIDRRNNPAGKKSRAEAIHGDLMTLLAAEYDESGKAQDEGAASDSAEEDEDESSAQA